jgi:hypothetical protein
MTTKLATTSTESLTRSEAANLPPWGKAHPRRGQHFDELARAFIKDFPIGSLLSPRQLDEWLQGQGLLSIPSTNAPKRGDAWLSHLQRRHEWRFKINRAGTHPRMEEGATPFVIEFVKGAKGDPDDSTKETVRRYQVRRPEVAAMQTQITQRMESLAAWHRKNLSYLLQSVDFDRLPVHEQQYLSDLDYEIRYAIKDTGEAWDRLEERVARAKARIKTSVERGEIKPINGGITALLAAASDEIE